MTMILDVQAMPRAEESRTRRLHNAFFDQVRSMLPTVPVKSLDLCRDHTALPTIDAWDISAKFEVAYGEGHLTEAQAERWNRIIQFTDQLHAASLVVVSAPMWNFSVPWHLKQWIDCVVQAQLTFEVTAAGYRGLLGGRAAVILTTRDGEYAEGSPMAHLDFHVPYLTRVLELMGFGPIHTVVAEGLWDPSKRDPEMVRGLRNASDLAQLICGQIQSAA
jgi:FMN-dependent NADH-azoreductase